MLLLDVFLLPCGDEEMCVSGLSFPFLGKHQSL